MFSQVNLTCYIGFRDITSEIKNCSKYKLEIGWYLTLFDLDVISKYLKKYKAMMLNISQLLSKNKFK